jgi:tetratricopeptide (TPR) repeat protein
VSFLHGKLGDTLNRPQEAREGITHYRASIAISERLAAQDTKDLQAQRNAALANVKLTTALYRMGKHADGLVQSRKATRMFEAIAKTDPANNLILLDLARAHLGSGFFLSALGKSDEAIAEYGHAADLLTRMVGRDGGNSLALIELSNTHLQMAKEYMVLARGTQARESLDAARKLAVPADDVAMQQEIAEASRQAEEGVRRLTAK